MINRRYLLYPPVLSQLISLSFNDVTRSLQPDPQYLKLITRKILIEKKTDLKV